MSCWSRKNALLSLYQPIRRNFRSSFKRVKHFVSIYVCCIFHSLFFFLLLTFSLFLLCDVEHFWDSLGKKSQKHNCCFFPLFFSAVHLRWCAFDSMKNVSRFFFLFSAAVFLEKSYFRSFPHVTNWIVYWCNIEKRVVIQRWRCDSSKNFFSRLFFALSEFEKWHFEQSTKLQSFLFCWMSPRRA